MEFLLAWLILLETIFWTGKRGFHFSSGQSIAGNPD
jgi:hypothetical protein